MKIATWNVNSINARIEHLIKFIKKDLSDIYLIQELKCINDQFPKNELKEIGYNSYINGFTLKKHKKKIIPIVSYNQVLRTSLTKIENAEL